MLQKLEFDVLNLSFINGVIRQCRKNTSGSDARAEASNRGSGFKVELILECCLCALEA
jgi:hypothetical protein